MVSPMQDALEHRLTQRDLEHTPDDGNLWEVIDGELHVTPFPSYPHQKAVTRLATLLDNHVREHGLGEVLTSGLKVVLDEPTGVGPDIVFIAAEHMDRMREDGYYGAPDLIVEVVSQKPHLDRYVKLHKYAQAGVPHYWIVDPAKRQLSELRLEGGRYRLVADIGSEASFSPGLFPGLQIDLGALWVL